MDISELQTHLAREHKRLYFDWAREIIKLSAGGLTLTVSLQNFYVKPNAHAIWLLALCWIALALALLLGLWVLRGEAVLHYNALDTLRGLRSDFQDQAIAQVLNKESLAELHPRYLRAYRAMPISFAAALVGLVLFGILNLP
ncbi:MAG: hypothetical protein ABSC03_01010 [Verrucomicrobiota bacterium]|jgi:hypothetical protein